MSISLKKAIVTMSIAMIALTGVITDAEAARLGGKRSTGMQRTTQQTSPDTAQNPTTANNPQRNPQAGATAPNTSQKPSTARRWLGTLAGLATGLGIAALLSHFGLGAGMANMLTMLLLAGLAFMLIRLVLNAFRPKTAQPSNGYGYNQYADNNAPSIPNIRAPSPFSNTTNVGTSLAHNATDVNADEFLRLAKGYFIRLQAANDKKDTDDLRRFLTPEMFAETQLQISERGNAEQNTDILQLNAKVLSIVTEGTHDIGSVHFTGQIKCSDQVMAENFSEVWHFTKWRNHSDQWSLAGIQQT